MIKLLANTNCFLLRREIWPIVQWHRLIFGISLLAMPSLILASSAFAQEEDSPSKSNSRLDDDEQRRRLDFFETKIRPVLIESCYECHSTEAGESNGGLALDSPDGWMRGGDSGPAIVPYDSDASLLVEAIAYQSLEMPPDGRLPDHVVADFSKWINDGALDPRPALELGDNLESDAKLVLDRELWSFEPLRQTVPPQSKRETWGVDPLDAFILEKMDSNGLSPSPRANRYALARRLSYDLTGLPPSPDSLTSFVEDDRPDAMERYVDRLLNSPRFGEHWGRHWLDVARYADSNGSDFNATFHNAWRYRNYVVEMFNRDRPYDQFVREQIAGDLMPFSNDEERTRQLIGSGFLVFGSKMLSERDKEKLRMDVVDEQIDTVGRSFMGLTLGCARCHDHKFDPISTGDYYSLAGIFRSTQVLDGEIQKYVSNWYRAELPMDTETERSLLEYESQLAELIESQSLATEDFTTLNKEWLNYQSQLPGVIVDDEDAEAIGDWKTSTFSPRFFGKQYRHDDKQAKGEKKLIYRVQLPVDGEYEVRTSFAAANGRSRNTPFSIKHRDETTMVRIDQSETPSGGKLFQSLGRFHFSSGENAVVTIGTDGTDGYVMADAIQFLPINPTSDVDESIAATNPEELVVVDNQVGEYLDRINRSSKALQDVKDRRTQLEKRTPGQRPLAIAVTEEQSIEDCAIRIRGEVHQLGEVKERNVPERLRFSGDLEIANDKSGRWELANWVASPQHPLTSRVMVNRVWSKLLGRGIVASVDNFGHLGERPTHPELLDSLAHDFIQHDWSIKYLVRRIVLSETYLQQSYVSPAQMERDPTNQWFARFESRRLTAESIRDGVLQMSGVLDHRVSGSPVKGFATLVVDNNKQEARAEEPFANVRTMFLPIIRNELPAHLTVFDFADPNFVVGKRATTSVPAQALLMLNSPFVHNNAEMIASQMTRKVAVSTHDRIESLFGLLLGRLPAATEVAHLRQFLATSTGVDETQLDTAIASLPIEAQREVWTNLIVGLMATSEFRMLE